MPEVRLFDCDYMDAGSTVYVLIGARYKGKWLFVKNRKRGSYEMPAGHVDSGENAGMAAGRELMEESGALKYTMECVNTYTVETNGVSLTGKLYYASIIEKGESVDREEILECIEAETLPGNLSFPGVQGTLFKRLEEYEQNI